MATTTIGWGDPKAQKKWGAELARDVNAKSYFSRKFIGKGANNIIEQKTALESDSGDRISFDLVVELKQEPTEGDNRLDGKEEEMRFFTDEVAIDQMRKSVSAGGRMTRKRTVHNLRATGKDLLSLYWQQYIDQMYFMYLSGARGINQNYKVASGWTGRAQNPLQPPDASHTLYGGGATSKGSVTVADKMTRAVIEKANVKANMMHALDPDAASMVPVTIKGANHYVIVMSHFQAFDLRNDAGAGNWMDITKAAAMAEGSDNRLFKGGLGMIDDTVLHKHQDVIRFADYGAGSDVHVSRALFMARQAAVVAYGTTNGNRGIWKEDKIDFDNEPRIAGGYIMGCKKTRYNGKDFGVIAIDTASKNPNP